MKIKKLNVGWSDIGLIKWSSITFTLFVVSIWSEFANWVIQTHWSWFLIVSIILAIKPVMRLLKK